MFLTSQRMPSRYGRVHMRIQSNKSTLRNCLSVIFLILYFIDTTLLVGVYKCINDIYGGTLPVLKNEIIDFFFARLGTGSTSLFLTSQRMPSRYKSVHTHIQLCKYIHAVSSVGYTIDVNDSFLLPSKYRRTSLHKAYNRVFDFVKSKSTG